jgi:hypothetical protein
MRPVMSMRWMLIMGTAMVLLGVYAQGALAAWKIQTSVPPTGATKTELFSISCEDGKFCMSVGDYVSSSGTQEPLAELEGAAELPPAPSGTSPVLWGVSCPTEEFCMAVGRYTEALGNPEALAEKWTLLGGWKLQTLTFPPGNFASELGYVSCPTATECTATGDYHNSGGLQYLVERWSGGTWAPEAPAAPAGAGFPYMQGISCPKAGKCMVGADYRSSGTGPWQMTSYEWGGSSWTQRATAATGGTNSLTTTLSCPAISECVMVGHITNGSGIAETMAQAWSGTAPWTAQAPKNPGTANELTGVDCPTSTTKCTAVGQSTTAGVTEMLGEELASGVWGVVSLEVPAGAKLSSMVRVSCIPSRPACIAAGYYVNAASETRMLIEAN